MDVSEFSMLKEEARKHWKEYVQGCKDNPKDKYMEDMKAVYNQLKSGRKLIDIFEAFKRAGLNEDLSPKLAICKADAKICYCKYSSRGHLTFTPREPEYFWQTDLTSDVRVGNVGEIKSNTILKTLVPPVPPSLRPKGRHSLSNYYTLWEVDKWEMIPPKDPYLLRRLTKNVFVVLGAWDLTELERAVIKGRMFE